MLKISPDLQPSHVSPTEAGLEVTWHGTIPHKSVYPWTWLHQNSYDPPLRSTAASPPTPTVAQHEYVDYLFFTVRISMLNTCSRRVLWGSRIQQDPPTMLYSDIMAGERAVWKWLQKIVCCYIIPCLSSLPGFQERFGFCFVTGVPANPEDTESLSRRIAHIRETQCQHLVFLKFTNLNII